MVASPAMNEVAERPSFRISFRLLGGVALALALLAFAFGRLVYERYGGYRPMALMHVPQTMRYRARVELNDPERRPAIAPLLAALDPRGQRAPALEKKLGLTGASLRELAWGAGPDEHDFVVVVGLSLSSGSGVEPAKAVCEVLAEGGIRSQPTDSGCRLEDGSLIAGTPDDTVVLANRAELVKDLLGRADIGDRLGFSGPSVRGVAPEPDELGREATTLAARLSAKYP